MNIHIHQWLLPNRKNKFHPAVLRPFGLMVFASLIIAIPFLYNITSAKQFQVLGYATNITVSDLHNLSNQERSNNGTAGLRLDSALNNAAQAKANDMIAKDYWAHVAPDGTTPWAFITAAGYQYTVAGENLAKDFNQSTSVVAGWMASPLHRDNVLNPAYQDVGYAVVNGVLQGSETTLVVAMYATRYTSPPAPAPTPAPTQTVTPQPAAVAPQATPTAPVAEAPASQPAATEQPKPATTKPATKADTSGVVAPKAAPTVAATDNGVVEGLATSLPVRTYNAFNWGQKTSIVLVSTLILLFLMKHTLIWREQKRGYRHIWLRAHPLAQAAMLTAVMVVTLVSGVGTVL